MDKEILKKIMVTAVGTFIAVSSGLLGTAAFVAAVVIGDIWKN